VNHRDLLIFDMDGVLVDVTESYREAIRATVEHFTGAPVSSELIQDFKNQGGWNDDWALSFRLIRDAGMEIGFDTVVDYFQSVFHGQNGQEPLINRERWVAEQGLFDRLRERYRLAIFTGRLHWEARVTLDRFAPDLFHPVIGADDVKATKPDPEGIFKIREIVPHDRVFYLGDTPDDARSAKAAGVPFVGIIGMRTPKREESVEVLCGHGAIAVLKSINEVEEVIGRQ
jgi:HAD superfamily hydrolase (TIGR01548 family)